MALRSFEYIKWLVSGLKQDASIVCLDLQSDLSGNHPDVVYIDKFINIKTLKMTKLTIKRFPEIVNCNFLKNIYLN
jgi:hypothetical protein